MLLFPPSISFFPHAMKMKTKKTTTRQKMRWKVDKFSAKFFTFRDDTCLPNKKIWWEGVGLRWWSAWSNRCANDKENPPDYLATTVVDFADGFRAPTFKTQILMEKRDRRGKKVQPPSWTTEKTVRLMRRETRFTRDASRNCAWIASSGVGDEFLENVKGKR